MRQRIILVAVSLLCVLSVSAQEVWTLERCMAYAVEHNHDVRRAELQADSYRASKLAAVGHFLPGVEANVGAQYNFGRAIDPETNTYTHVNTFYNGYSVSLSMPIFDGFSRLHALRAAKADVLMGRESLRCQQDETALATLQAYVDACYYEGMVRMAEEHRQECELLLRQTALLVEVGRKSQADLAQIEAQQAEADYEVTRQRNRHASALLELSKQMGTPNLQLATSFPLEDYDLLSSTLLAPTPTAEGRTPAESGAEAGAQGGLLLQSYYAAQSARHEWDRARAGFYPSLSLGVGMNTTFYKTLHSHGSPSFSHQFRNNRGEYVAVSLSVPIFNRLQTLTSVRRAKNNYLMAQEAYEQKKLEVEKLCMEACGDFDAYRMQTVQMKKKVEADSLAYQLTRRQYEEGLSTAIDLHTTSVQLLQSRATLLQCRLMVLVKHYLLRYYRGEQIW